MKKRKNLQKKKKTRLKINFSADREFLMTKMTELTKLQK